MLNSVRDFACQGLAETLEGCLWGLSLCHYVVIQANRHKRAFKGSLLNQYLQGHV